MNIICRIFGHALRIAMTVDEMWLSCKRCPHQEDIPKDREQEAYEKIRNNDWKWIK